MEHGAWGMERGAWSVEKCDRYLLNLYISKSKIDNRKSQISMGCFRVIICIICPPLAVIDKGCGSVLIVFLLTLCGWVPGVIGALIINKK